MGKIFLKKEAFFKDVNRYFEGGLELWSSKDSIHLSTDHGLPRLISCIIDGLEEADDFYEYDRHQKETATTAEGAQLGCGRSCDTIIHYVKEYIQNATFISYPKTI